MQINNINRTAETVPEQTEMIQHMKFEMSPEEKAVLDMEVDILNK